MNNLVKYGRTYHFPFSETITPDDKTLEDLTPFEGELVVYTEKMDGENTSVYTNYLHARSLDSNNHPSRNWVKGYWAERQFNIPEGWRVCGENLYAQHSVEYDNLQSYFYCFNIWNDKNECLSYEDTLEWCNLLDIIHVPVLYVGVFNYDLLTSMYKALDKEKQEGIVVRLAKSFHYDDFGKSVGKIVRPNHVQTDEHWMSKPIIPNKLINKTDDK